MRGGARTVTAAFIALALLALAIGPFVGAESIDPSLAWREYLNAPRGAWSPDARILALRVPRVLFGFACGAALALSGAAMQTLLRNPLASPYTLGVSSAGSFGAFLAAALAGGSALAWAGTLERVSALICALLATLCVLAFARRSTRSDGLILAGIALSFLFGAGVVILRHLADPLDLALMDRWMLGAVDVIGFSPLFELLPWILVAGFMLLRRAPALDQLAFDEELAAARGVPVQRVRRESTLAAAALAAAVVAVTGPVGFVGLLVPHAVRPFTGMRHAVLLPCSALAGGALLVGADAIARTVQLLGRGSELPVGAVTAVLGAPFLLLLLLRRRP
ncbi:MAG: iron ABC transporter permease [Planctomycetota bacterium]|nr:iron ABC transporter permease [Planctomycetota bacterium]